MERGSRGDRRAGWRPRGRLQTIADYAKLGIALLQPDFRAGPHESLGALREIEEVCPEGEPMGLQIDGVTQRFIVTRCEASLLETIDD